MNLKDKYLKSVPQEYPAVTLPDGEVIHVRKILLSEVIDLDAIADRQVSLASWIVATACDEKGNPIFDKSDVPAINKMPAEWGMTIFHAARKINNLMGESVIEKKS